ncbi:MAG: ATP-binding protein [Clostridia bacterium]
MIPEEKYNRRKIKFENEQKKLITELFTPRMVQIITSLPELNHELKKGLFIFGEVGKGKTIMSARIMWEEVKRNYIYDNDFKTFKFVSVPELLLELRNTFSSKESKELEILEKYANVDVLVLDDIGIEKVSEWTYQTLYLIINRRYEQLKTTIFTSNYSLNQLVALLNDDRIPSRIFEMCDIVELTGEDYRLTKK